jgi:hypothetical protein
MLMPNEPRVVGRGVLSTLTDLHLSRNQAVFLWRYTESGESVIDMVNVSGGVPAVA